MTTNAPDPLDELPDPVAAEAFRRLVRHLRHRHAGAHAVPGVEGGDLVGFGERRVVEDRIPEVSDITVVLHDRLADVDQFGGTLAEDVNAEQLQGFAMEQQLQSAGLADA